MVRLVLRLLKIKDYEPCKSCEVLKQQLDIVNQERADLLATIMGLVKPEVVQQQITTVMPTDRKALPWAQRKKILEEEDRARARVLGEVTRKIETVEKEVGLDESSKAEDSSREA